MHFQHCPGGKIRSGGMASSSESNRDWWKCLWQLALETIDINKDPYFIKNHLGLYECKLHLTLHNNGGGAISCIPRGKSTRPTWHKEGKEAPAQPALEKVKVKMKKFVKIGCPGYKVTKQRDTDRPT
ncbi:unnamed protein product [Pipistrellus nathusii]|uniref:Uncharacterized protein n=1 Tax=Pipistrellus nathusii TaxID=59473 RepID=A0ABN9Z2Y2_PIPNA